MALPQKNKRKTRNSNNAAANAADLQEETLGPSQRPTYPDQDQTEENARHTDLPDNSDDFGENINESTRNREKLEQELEHARAEIDRLRRQVPRSRPENNRMDDDRHCRNLQVLNRCHLLNAKFDGGENIEPWLRNYDLFASLNGRVFRDMTEKEKVTFLKTLLTERVQMLIDRDQTLVTVDLLIAKLRST